MKIGIGVTTFNRFNHIELWLSQVTKHAMDCQIFISEDTFTNRKGIAYRKNECLKALQHCDYIFLFDDDCFPIKDGWIDYFIDCHKASGQHHFLYLKETNTLIKEGQKDYEYNGKRYQIDIFDNAGGCFMFLTKEAISTVGGFCKEYGIYGFEHAGYSTRINLASLTTDGKYLSPSNAMEYIYSLDYDNYLPFNGQVNHSTSIELNKINDYIKNNYIIFKKDIETIYQSI